MKNKTLNDILFKLIIHRTDSSLLLPFAIEQRKTTIMSHDGKQTDSDEIIVVLLKVEETLAEGSPAIDQWIVTDQQELLSNVEILSPDDIIPQMLIETGSVILNDILEKTKQLRIVGAASNAINSLLKNGKAGKIIFNSEENLMDLTYKSIIGDTKIIKKNQVTKMGELIYSILVDNIDIDLENEVEVKKLIAEINYKMIEALPNGTKVENINISVEGVKSEINRIREIMNSSEDLDDDTEE